MSPVVSRQLVEVVDTRNAMRTLPLAPEHVLEQPLDRWRVAAWGLRTTVLSPEDPFVLAETCWLLPDHGLRLRRRRPRATSRRRRARSRPRC